MVAILRSTYHFHTSSLKYQLPHQNLVIWSSQAPKLPKSACSFCKGDLPDCCYPPPQLHSSVWGRTLAVFWTHRQLHLLEIHVLLRTPWAKLPAENSDPGAGSDCSCKPCIPGRQHIPRIYHMSPNKVRTILAIFHGYVAAIQLQLPALTCKLSHSAQFSAHDKQTPGSSKFTPPKLWWNHVEAWMHNIHQFAPAPANPSLRSRPPCS